MALKARRVPVGMELMREPAPAVNRYLQIDWLHRTPPANNF